MKRSFIITTVLLLGALSFSTLVIAQKPEKSERKAAMKEMRQEMRKYAETNIIPVMKPQRDKLEVTLSAAERQEVLDIRAGLEAQKEEMEAQHKEMRKLRKDGGEPSQAQKDAKREMQKNHRHLMDRAWVIVDAHEDEIYSLLDATQSEQDQWREDIKAIAEKHKESFRPEGKEEMATQNGKKGHQGARGHKGGKGQMGGKMGLMRGAAFLKPVGFLLWDGNMPEARKFDRVFEGENTPSELTVFPNPSSQINNLSFSVKKAGAVNIILIDEDGKKVQTLLSEQMDAGNYTKQFSLDELAPGVYYYQINAPGERSVKRFLIEE